ncbi:hypothetical protein K9M48_05065 [Candidatus Gracilibacteria bacterium]|nr:hypothetical protein [Candidatus Gracilibacteria bacterium]
MNLNKGIKKDTSLNVSDAFDSYRSFMGDFLEIFNLIKPNFELYVNGVMSKKMIITISSPGSNLLLSQYLGSKYLLEKTNTDIFCLGKDGFDSFIGSGFNILGCCNIRKDFQESDFEDLFHNINLGIDKSKYSNISVCFVDENGNVSELDLFPICGLDIDYFSSRFSLNFDYHGEDIEELCILPGAEDIQKSLVKQYIQHIIYGLILEQKSSLMNSAKIKTMFNKVMAVR